MPRQRLLFASIAAIAVLGCLLIAYVSWRSPSREHIYASRTGVEEISLLTEGFPPGRRPLPVMGLGYARWVNFARIAFNGETYNQVGSGATIIRNGELPTRYIVQETLKSRDGPFGPLQYASLNVVDTTLGSVIATKEWRCTADDCRISSDDSAGWQGQQAALFVRKALNPKMEIGGAVGIKPYPKTVARVEMTTPIVVRTRAQLTTRTIGCPASVSVFVRKDINAMVVSNGQWTFVPPNLAHQVHCLPIGLFVVSSTFPNDLFLDWISYEGKLLGQFHTSGPIFPSSGGGTFQYASEIHASEEAIRLRVLYYHDKWPQGDEALPGQWESVVEIDVKASHRSRSTGP